MRKFIGVLICFTLLFGGIALFEYPERGHATISTEVTRNSYSGNGSQTVFPYTFKVFANTDLRVILRDANAVETIQTLTTHYSVSGVGSDSGGNVTMVTAPASGETLVILRDMPLKQESDWVPKAPFLANTLESDLDKLLMKVQQLEEKLDRALKFKETSSYSNIEFPEPVADKAVVFNSTGDGLAVGTLSSYANTEIAHIGEYSDSLNTAITQIGSNKKTLIINKAITLTAAATVPNNIHLFMLREGKVTLGNYNLTINGPLSAPISQIFDDSGSGVVTFGNGYVPIVYPEWWGAIADESTDCEPAINSANTSLATRGGEIKLGRGVYVVGSKLKIGASVIGRSVTLSGVGPVATIIKANLTTAVIESPNTGLDHQRNIFRDFNVTNTSESNSGGIGLNLAGQFLTKIQNVRISEVETGIYIDKYYNEILSVEIKTVVTGIKFSGTSANENKILYGRISSCTTGINVDKAYNIVIVGMAIESATTGIIVNDDRVKIIACLFDTMTTAVSITSSASGTMLIGNAYPSCTTKISDSGVNTQEYEAAGRFQVAPSGTITKDTRTKEFFASGSGLDDTLALDITFQSQTANYINHLVEIHAAMGDTAGAVCYSSIVRYSVVSYNTLTTADMTHDLIGGVTEGVSSSGTVLTVTLTLPGSVAIDGYAVWVKVTTMYDSADRGVPTGISVS